MYLKHDRIQNTISPRSKITFLNNYHKILYFHFKRLVIFEDIRHKKKKYSIKFPMLA